MSNTWKTCPKCQVEFELTVEFWHRHSGRKDGFDSHCKVCKGIRRKYLYERNAEEEKARVRKWRKDNRTQARAQRAARRARKAGNGVVEIVQYPEVYSRSNGICGLCQEPVSEWLFYPDQMAGTIDHIKPLSRGGQHVYTNVQLAHSLCNSKKGNRYE